MKSNTNRIPATNLIGSALPKYLVLRAAYIRPWVSQLRRNRELQRDAEFKSTTLLLKGQRGTLSKREAASRNREVLRKLTRLAETERQLLKAIEREINYARLKYPDAPNFATKELGMADLAHAVRVVTRFAY